LATPQSIESIGEGKASDPDVQFHQLADIATRSFQMLLMSRIISPSEEVCTMCHETGDPKAIRISRQSCHRHAADIRKRTLSVLLRRPQCRRSRRPEGWRSGRVYELDPAAAEGRVQLEIRRRGCRYPCPQSALRTPASPRFRRRPLTGTGPGTDWDEPLISVGRERHLGNS
jgi:hypothetical protein